MERLGVEFQLNSCTKPPALLPIGAKTETKHEWEDDDWDRQMKRDVAEGKLNKLLKKVDADIAQGNLSSLP